LPQNSKDIWGFLGMYGFYIVGILAPLFLLTALFMDIVESSGVVQGQTYRRIIGGALGLLAYRGFIVTRLVYILDIGSTGVAVIALNFIFLGGILSYINRAFQQWRQLESAEALGRFSQDHLRALAAIAHTWVTWNDVQTSFINKKILCLFYQNSSQP
jgi:hypothetical protein